MSQNSTYSGANVANLAVDANNRPVTSVQVCVPGTTTCQTISNIVVDTGSAGLRIFASALTVTLPGETLSDGGSLAECAQFPDHFDWGWIASADISVANETASAAPVQVVADPSFPGVPLACSGSGLTANQSSQAFGASGILGLGVLASDCGATCASGAGGARAYYDCSKTAGVCNSSAAPLAQQVQNPVSLFAKDNNGIIISLPQVDTFGSSGVSGALVFGIGTESNNTMPTTVPAYLTDTNGNLSASYNSNTYDTCYLSSGLQFTGIADSAAIPNNSDCAFGGTEQGLYCPANEVTANVTVTGATPTTGGTSTAAKSTVTVEIVNASNLFSNSANTAFNDLGGAAPGAVIFGLPFFLGRDVFVAITGKTAGSATGPFFGF